MALFLYVFNRKKGPFLGHFTPFSRGVWYGPLRALKRGGPRPPGPPKSMILGHFWPFWPKKAWGSQISGILGPSDPPKTHFLTNFRKIPGYPPWFFKNRQKTSRFRPEIFQNFRKVIEKGPFFGQSWDLGPFYPILGVKMPFLPCQYPQPPAFLGPSYEFVCRGYSTVEGSQRLRPS